MTLFIPSVSLKRVRMVRYEIGVHHMFNISQGDFNCPTFGKIIKTSGAACTVRSVNQIMLRLDTALSTVGITQSVIYY